MNAGDTYALDRILKHLIRLRDGTVEYFHLKRREWYPKKPFAHPETGRLRYAFGPNRYLVYRNRLVWMITHRREIPGDQVVDHIDENRLNDDPNNLRLMNFLDSVRQGNRIQQDAKLEELSRWFLFVGSTGREPDMEDPVDRNWIYDGFYGPWM